MKKLILILFIAILGVACTDNQRSRKFGGKQTIKLQAGEKLVIVTWKEADLWYLTEPMEDDYIPKQKVFKEDSNFGLWNGEITFVESR